MTDVVLRQGLSFGPYKLVALLGKGQGGEVWAAVGKDGGIIALKVFSGATTRNAAESEFNIGSAQDCLNILKPLSFSVIEGFSAMAMPLCEGRSSDNAAGYYSETMAYRQILGMVHVLTSRDRDQPLLLLSMIML